MDTDDQKRLDEDENCTRTGIGALRRALTTSGKISKQTTSSKKRRRNCGICCAVVALLFFSSPGSKSSVIGKKKRRRNLNGRKVFLDSRTTVTQQGRPAQQQ
jgi:hypothetical protein